MLSGGLLRAFWAGGCAAAIAALLATSAAAGDSSPLPPDLVVLPIGRGELFAVRDGAKTRLLLTTEVANRGNGPIEVIPSSESHDCDTDGVIGNDRDVSQRIFQDTNGSGGFEPSADGVYSERPFGCMHYHPAHNHWHVLDFALYELRRDPGGKAVAKSGKVSFCLRDTRQVFPGPFSPASPSYPFASTTPGVDCDPTATQGISVGWGDSYPHSLPGQSLTITGLRRGRYCLIAIADPLGLLEESDDANNVRRVRIALRPRKPSVRRLDGRCTAASSAPAA